MPRSLEYELSNVSEAIELDNFLPGDPPSAEGYKTQLAEFNSALSKYAEKKSQYTALKNKTGASSAEALRSLKSELKAAASNLKFKKFKLRFYQAAIRKVGEFKSVLPEAMRYIGTNELRLILIVQALSELGLKKGKEFKAPFSFYYLDALDFAFQIFKKVDCQKYLQKVNKSELLSMHFDERLRLMLELHDAPDSHADSEDRQKLKTLASRHCEGSLSQQLMANAIFKFFIGGEILAPKDENYTSALTIMLNFMSTKYFGYYAKKLEDGQKSGIAADSQFKSQNEHKTLISEARLFPARIADTVKQLKVIAQAKHVENRRNYLSISTAVDLFGEITKHLETIEKILFASTGDEMEDGAFSQIRKDLKETNDCLKVGMAVRHVKQAAGVGLFDSQNTERRPTPLQRKRLYSDGSSDDIPQYESSQGPNTNSTRKFKKQAVTLTREAIALLGVALDYAQNGTISEPAYFVYTDIESFTRAFQTRVLARIDSGERLNTEFMQQAIYNRYDSLSSSKDLLGGAVKYQELQEIGELISVLKKHDTAALPNGKASSNAPGL